MKSLVLGFMIFSVSAAAFAEKIPVIKSELNLTGKVSSELDVSIEVYAESTNRTRPELTIDGWKQVPLISDKTEELEVNGNSYAKKLVSNWSTAFGTNYQARVYRIHLSAAGFSDDSVEIYVDKNCGNTPGFEAGNIILVTKKTDFGSPYLSAQVVNRVTDTEGARALCISPRDNETLNEQLDIVLK